jgi:hypothetical protein
VRSGLDCREEAGAVRVGIDRFVEERGADSLEEGRQFARGSGHDLEQLAREGFEQGGPPLDGDPVGDVWERRAHEREEATAHDEREDGRVEECLDDVAVAARHLVDAVVVLEFLEEQLDPPSMNSVKRDRSLAPILPSFLLLRRP